jgi:ferredoxin
MRVSIDPKKCHGHALCIGIAPEAFEFHDLEDRSVVKEGAESRVPAELLVSAARACPERAITVELDGQDGGAAS